MPASAAFLGYVVVFLVVLVRWLRARSAWLAASDPQVRAALRTVAVRRMWVTILLPFAWFVVAFALVR
jgi:hypothetical protein